MTILIFVAHSDDQVLGPGGTVAKYSAEGQDVYTFIFSYGELSHPHFKKEIITQVRIEEAVKADKLLGGKGVEFLGAGDGKIKEKHDELKEQVKNLIIKYAPTKIFTHAEDEALPDHVAVNKIVLEAYDELIKEKNITVDIYSFGIWRFFKWKQRSDPKLFVDISGYFYKKLDALQLFKSQRIAMITLKWSVYLKAFTNGFQNRTQFAEVFYKIR
jgi:LmbE family N-acetylglucosaminyl deacetylase